MDELTEIVQRRRIKGPLKHDNRKIRIKQVGKVGENDITNTANMNEDTHVGEVTGNVQHLR